jgi:putative effector of murein hydrolase LrgA (UPF0299 family)
MSGSRMITILTPAQIAQNPTTALSLAVAGAVLLLLLLALREVAANAGKDGWRRLANSLNIAIVPLLMTFVMAIAVVIGNYFRMNPPR